MDIVYEVIRSKRRTTSIEISRTGSVRVRCPLGMPDDRIAALVNAHKPWLEAHLNQGSRQKENTTKLTDDELQMLVKEAGDYFPSRVAYYAGILGVSYGRITIRKQKTKWGSCSSKGNLNFNALLMLAPCAVRDYIVVHELCHRKHLDHSASFWNTVAWVMPDYREREKWLKENGHSLMGKLWD